MTYMQRARTIAARLRQGRVYRLGHIEIRVEGAEVVLTDPQGSMPTGYFRGIPGAVHHILAHSGYHLQRLSS